MGQPVTGSAPQVSGSPPELPAEAGAGRPGASRSLQIVGLLGGLLLGKGMAAQGAEQVTDPISLGFVRDMSVHHGQAVQLSEIAHRRSNDPKLNCLAFDIGSIQQGQMKIMSGQVELWGHSQSGADDPMIPSTSAAAWRASPAVGTPNARVGSFARCCPRVVGPLPTTARRR